MPGDENFSTKNERVVLWVQLKPNHYSGKSSIGVGWSVGQNKSFSKCPGFNFSHNLYEQRVLCQKNKKISTKNERVVLWAQLKPYHYSGKGSIGVRVVGRSK